MGPDEEHDFRSWIRQGLNKAAPLSRTRALVESGQRHDGDLWAGLVDLGVLGLAIDEDHGGGGATPGELALFLMEAGRVLLPAGYLGGSVVAPWLLRGDAAAAADLLPHVASGEARAAVAEMPAATVSGPPERPRLSGTIPYVADADICDHLLLLTPDAEVHLVASRDALLTSHTSLDETRPVSMVVLEDAPARRVNASPGDVAQARSLLALALAAESAGAIDRILELTLDHVLTRTQFGGPIGRFQAVKHRCADMFVSLHAATAMVLDSFNRIAETGRVDSLTSLATAAFVADAFVSATTAATQLHGGIAFTWEHDVHFYLKRARSNQLIAGGADRRIASLGDTLMSNGESVLVMLGLEKSANSD